MKLAIVLSTKEPELVWNGLRLGVTALEAGDRASAFLLGQAVEFEAAARGSGFGVRTMLEEFVAAGGGVLTCGTCLDLRKMGSPQACAISSMTELLKLIHSADRVVSLG